MKLKILVVIQFSIQNVNEHTDANVHKIQHIGAATNSYILCEHRLMAIICVQILRNTP